MKNPFSFYKNCTKNHHIWNWIGNEEIPEGLPCICGQLLSHYESCDKCGTTSFKPTLVITALAETSNSIVKFGNK